MARSIEQIVRDVEDADVKQLENVDVDDVYAQMDHVLSERPSPLDLYRRWEKQQWAVADLDFTADKQHWADLIGPMKDFLQNTFTLFFIGEQAVTDTLSPLIMGAATEEDRIFLSTQIVDEARHTVFFQRFFEEVVGVGGGLHGALESVKPDAVAGFRQIFDDQLVAYTDAVRLDPTDYDSWVRGITCYHLIVEGTLALTGQKFSLRTIRRVGILPGFYAGFTAVTRDESRHVNYGVGAAQIAVSRGRGSVIEETIDELLQPSIRTIAAPDRKLPINDPSILPEDLRVSPLEVANFSLFSLTKRLRVIGLPETFIDHVNDEGMKTYRQAWAEYEETHSEKHPVRWYEAQAV